MQIYTTKDILDKLQISRNTLLNWFKKGKMRDVDERDRNGYRIFTEQDLSRLLAYKNRTVVNAFWKAKKNKRTGIVKRSFLTWMIFLFFVSARPISSARAEEMIEIKNYEASVIKNDCYYGEHEQNSHEETILKEDIERVIKNELKPNETKRTRIFDVSGIGLNDADNSRVNDIGDENQDLSEIFTETNLFSEYERMDCQPIADAGSDISEGIIPFAVNFSGLGFDDDGDVAMYKWNFLGKGRETWSSRESGDSVYVYRQAGLFTPVFWVVNSRGYADTYCMMINAQAGDNGTVIEASADVYDGIAPLEVGFSGSAFSSGREVVRYEWDFDGDGVYDWQSKRGSMVMHRYTQGGIYPATLRVTDNRALMVTKVVYISVDNAQNAPSVTARVDIDNGTCPVTVLFDALSEGSTDIVRYEWDFDGDGVFDWESEHTSFVEHVFREPGVYSPKIKITGDNLLTAVNTISVRVEKNPDKLCPISDFETNVSVGKIPLEVCFLELALSGDSEISKYEWDFDGDGIWDEIFEETSQNQKGNADTRYVYDEVGLYKAVLKVTDKEGLSDRASKFITVTDFLPPIFHETEPPAGDIVTESFSKEGNQEISEEKKEVSSREDENICVSKEEFSDFSEPFEEFLPKTGAQSFQDETKEEKNLNLEQCLILDNTGTRKPFKEKAEKIKNRIIRAIIQWLENLSCEESRE